MRAARALSAALLAAGGLLPAAGAIALPGDQLELSVAETAARDDNVFRLSNGRDPVPLLGSPSKADTYYTTTVGLKLDVPVSRQRFQAELALSDTRYERFKILNLKGHNARALWLWQVGNDLSGQAGISEVLSLASLANVQGGVQSSTPNFLTTTRGFVNAAYLLTPSLRLRGELGRLAQSNEAAERRVNDVEIDSIDSSLSYVSRAGNELGLGLRLDDARLPERQPVASGLISNSYRQHTIALIGEWTPSGHSRLRGRAGWFDRRYQDVPQRDFDGGTFRVDYDWRPTAKITVNAAVFREPSTAEEINVGFVLARGAALRPSYKLSEKIDLTGTFEYSNRDYRGEAERALGLVPPRTDRVRLGILSASYRPTESITLEFTLRRETRTSTDAFGGYSSNAIGASARIAF